MGGVLAIDHGEKKSGFAVADPGRVLVQPLETVRIPGDSSDLLDHVAALLTERDVSTLLVGLPLAPDGSLGARAESVLRFVATLRERFPDREVHTHDEHLTTKEAESRLREAGFRGSDVKQRRDSWSAMVLLEDWLAAGEPG